jgi:long-chain fatty acid transport protein
MLDLRWCKGGFMTHRVWAIVLSGLAGSATPLFAQGYGVYEQSACAMGRGGAAVAAPCADGSSIFFNPAGLAFESGTLLSAGGSIISPRGTFEGDVAGVFSRLRDKNYFAPAVYYRRSLPRRVTFGVGLFAPYGLTTDWPSDSVGRFLGYKSLVESIYVQPTVAFRANERVAVGAGVDITYLRVQLRRRADLSTQPLPGAPNLTFAALGVPEGTDFADLDLKGNAFHAGFHVGVLVRPHDRVSFGARFLSGQKVDVDDGELETTQIPTGLVTRAPLPGIPAGTPLDTLIAPAFSQGGPLSTGQGASTSLPLPAQFVVGSAVDVTDALRLLADYQFTNWSAFDVLDINTELAPRNVIVEDFRDAHGLRAGAEYKLSDRTTLRGGFVANTAAVPDQTVTPNLPEGERLQITGGLGQRLTNRLWLDLYYIHLFQDDRRGRTTDGGLAVPTTAVNNGVYKFHANLFGASVVLSF